ncbi:MAG: DUF4926 domain-containing protein [Balneola sp.]
MFEEYDVVISKTDLNPKVSKNTKGTVLIVFGKNVYEIEFFDGEEKSLGTFTVKGENLSSVSK